MRILITNDDGINAPGLKVLHEIASDVAGPGGEVWTVAPAFEQSGVGHCISYTHPFMVAELGERRFAAEGSPADCVLAALYDIMPERPDLVLSGVNRGNNAGENTLYSGTIGAAMEAALQGLPAMALSQFYGPENRSLDNPFEAAAMHGGALVEKLLHNDMWDRGDYHSFLNINFPPVPARAVKGPRIVAQGYRKETFFGVERHHAPSGRKFLWIKGGPQDLPTAPDTDVRANLEGYISVTPMRCDLTAHDLIAPLRDLMG
jgi:5'-nucleotidase